MAPDPTQLASNCKSSHGRVEIAKDQQQQQQQRLLTRLAQARLDVVLLQSVTLDAVNGGMEDIVVHVGQGAHRVEEQLGAVLALDGDQPVVVHAAVCDAHVRPAVLGRPASSVISGRRQGRLQQAAELGSFQPHA